MAADLLSQAEHDELASAILITTSEELAAKVSEEVDGFLKELSRRAILEKSLENYGHILIADNMDDAIDTVNAIASEHLEIVTKNPFELMTKVTKCRSDLPGRVRQRASGRLFRRPEPCASHQWNRPFLLTLRCG